MTKAAPDTAPIASTGTLREAKSTLIRSSAERSPRGSRSPQALVLARGAGRVSASVLHGISGHAAGEGASDVSQLLVAVVRPNAEEMAALLAARAKHRGQLVKDGLFEPEWPLAENAYNGLLLAAMLDPATQPAVLRALYSGEPRLTVSSALVTAVHWPTSGVDLVVRQGNGARSVTTLIEHKRFASPSHAPGYKSNPDAAWQTDRAYEATLLPEPPSWLAGYLPGSPVRFVVLDGFGKSMDRLYEGGEHNDRWALTGYGTFGQSLWRAHKAGTPGLVALLTALYAGDLPPVERARRR